MRSFRFFNGFLIGFWPIYAVQIMFIGGVLGDLVFFWCSEWEFLVFGGELGEAENE